MIIDIDRKKRRAREKELSHDELVKTQVSGPAHSYTKGQGITEAIGPNAARMIETMMNPTFIESTFGASPLLHAKARREELAELGRHGFNGQMPGKSVRGDLQYFASMPTDLFITLMWTDPTLFQDEKRLEAYLIKSGLAVVKPRD